MGRQCAVVWFWAQRVRCTRCGQTHTLLPAFVAGYQRHPNRVRQTACAEREAGASWRAVLTAVGLPMLSTMTVRRWVVTVMRSVPAMAQAVAGWRAAGPAGAMAVYAPVARAGSLQALVQLAQQSYRCGAYTESALRTAIRAHLAIIRQIQQQIRQLEQAIAERMTDLPAHLQSIPGIDPVFEGRDPRRGRPDPALP